MLTNNQELNTAYKDTPENDAKVARIRELLKEKNAVLLTHIYQRLEVQRASDFVGDSLDLSRIAAKTDAKIIVFSGVLFMAETAKLLSPNKKILLPHSLSECPLADMVTPRELAKLKEEHPGAPVVCYINSSAAVKAESDYCCTSSNVVDVVRSIPDKKIIFIPDKGLGAWVAKLIPEKEVIIYDGFCPTHYQVNTTQVQSLKDLHPDAVVAAHPECADDVLELADFIGSTSKIYNFAKDTDATKIVILSEFGLTRRLQADFPEKKFLMTFPNPNCPNMKYNTLDAVIHSLENEVNEVTLPEMGVPGGMFERASNAMNRMFEITGDTFKPSTWLSPETKDEAKGRELDEVEASLKKNCDNDCDNCSA